MRRLVTNIPATTAASFGTVTTFKFVMFFCRNGLILLWLFVWYVTGHEIVEYESPRPTSGIHRIAFVLFRQLGRQIVHAPRWRHNFNTRDFAQVYNLGLPVAAVYFNCQRETGWGGRRA